MGQRTPQPVPTTMRLVVVVVLSLGLPGCGGKVSGLGPERPDPGPPGLTLRIATPWPPDERLRIETEFREWASQPGSSGEEAPSRISWIVVPARLGTGPSASHLPRADVLLGGPLDEYVRLARLGLLAVRAGSDEATLSELTRYCVTLSGGPLRSRGTVAFDDPRIDAATLAWLESGLRATSWGAGYAGLVRLAGRCRLPIGWHQGSARGMLERGEVDQAVLVVRDSPTNRPPDELATPLREGASPLPGSASEATGAFLRFLADRQGAVPLAQAQTPEPVVSELIADLLGSTLVDAQEELLDAWSALGGAETASPSAALTWMTEAPPWPPASVQRLLSGGGDRGLGMVQDLTGQLTPDAELRFWLIQSWLRPSRPIDQTFLTELARASRGRMVLEPRFRSWLRSEWTAWARQRYRRVARLAAAAVPAPRDVPSP